MALQPPFDEPKHITIPYDTGDDESPKKAYITVNWLMPENQPGWVANAKSRPMLEAVGAKLQGLLPDDPENSILKRISPGSGGEENDAASDG